jgi:hypothetical protein
MKKIQKTKATGNITVELTAENTRKLRELVALIHHDDPAQFVNFMLGEEMDSYLDASSGLLYDTVDGWTYDTAAEARATVKDLNAWLVAADCVGGGHLLLRTRGRRIITPTDDQRKAASKRSLLTKVA